MIKFLVKIFVKNYENTSDPEVRKAYGIFSGVLGIFLNVFLFAVKLVTGFMMNSIAIISDAFNNLTDSASSVVTIFGANWSSKPPDKEHPYGHGRMNILHRLSWRLSFLRSVCICSRIREKDHQSRTGGTPCHRNGDSHSVCFCQDLDVFVQPVYRPDD